MKNQYSEEASLKIAKGTLKLKVQEDFEQLKFSDDFFENLHDEIMEKVADVEIERESAVFNASQRPNSNWRSWVFPMGGLLALILVFSGLMSSMERFHQAMQRVGLFSDGHERIVAEAIAARDDLQRNLISMQSEEDFFVDVASESIENSPRTYFIKNRGERVR